VPLRLRLNADCPGRIHTLRRAGSADALSAAELSALLADVRGNPGSTVRLAVDATTYLQGAEPNHNFIRFREGSMRALARSFVGRPFLRDHNTHDFTARGGTITASELVEAGDGTRAIRQTIELVKPWAVEAALDGTLDRFSIGWRATGPVTCTVCDAPYLHGYWPTCEHRLGETYEVRKVSRLAEAEFSASEGVEVSGVSVPAVENTSIDAIRAALAVGDVDVEMLREAVKAFAADGGAISIQGDSPMNFAAIAKALGLAVTVDESTILAEIGRRETLLEQERTVRAEVETRLAAAEERENATRRAAVMDRALREGKVRPNSPLAEKLAALAVRSIEMAEATVTDLPRITPVGAPMQSAEPAPTGAAAAAAGAVLTDSDAEVARQLRIKPERMLAAKAANGRV
jgi:hypothetical protein